MCFCVCARVCGCMGTPLLLQNNFTNNKKKRKTLQIHSTYPKKKKTTTKHFKIKARVKTQNTTGKRSVYFQVSSNQFGEEKKKR